jgi:glycosyltransferase involved in cell wall biosynthesis
MKKMKEKGFAVTACANEGEPYSEKLKKEFSFKKTPLKRSIDFFGRDFLYFLQIFFICKKEKPDICHNFTIKPCIYGTVAQKMAGVKKIYCTITGLGYAFEREGFLKKIVVFLYKRSLKKADKVIFQNPDDRDLFINLGIIKKEKAKLIRSSGVDLEKFSPRHSQSPHCHSREGGNLLNNHRRDSRLRGNDKKTTPRNDGAPLTISLIARMLYQKGVREFVESAKILRTRHDNLQFLLVGPVDTENPSGIKIKQIEEWNEKGVVTYLEKREDIREVLSLSDIFTLPAISGEGVPKILLEAGAMELPLITTNVPGCREAVKDGVNGFLIEPKDVSALVEKIEFLINNEEKRKQFGRASRKIMEEEFSEEKVVKETVKIYNL